MRPPSHSCSAILRRSPWTHAFIHTAYPISANSFGSPFKILIRPLLTPSTSVPLAQATLTGLPATLPRASRRSFYNEREITLFPAPLPDLLVHFAFSMLCSLSIRTSLAHTLSRAIALAVPFCSPSLLISLIHVALGSKSPLQENLPWPQFNITSHIHDSVLLTCFISLPIELALLEMEMM